MRICIIGAGAAGCFCAIETARRMPDATVEVFEGGSRALAKVAITGGGRCNLTNSFRQIHDLKQAYPRGEKLMKRVLRQWSHEDTMNWFQQEGVALVTQEDECVFPQSQDAMQIVDTLLKRMEEANVKLHLSHRVEDIVPQDDKYEVHFADPKLQPRIFDHIVITIGGCPSQRQMGLFRHLNVDIQPPVPSLFTFNIKDEGLNSLMGTVVEGACTSIAGTKFRAQGPLLITHWGVSGPATLKLSSYAARHLAEHDMQADLCINWLGDTSDEQAREQIAAVSSAAMKGLAANTYPTCLTQKLWRHLLYRAGIPADARWADISGKKLNKLITVLTSDTYHISDKGQYKDEFVTCGGIALSSINISTLEMKNHPGIFLAGEVLDVDAITGGFNLQAAWSMGYVVAAANSTVWTSHR